MAYCKGCGTEKAYWVRSGATWEICSECAPNERVPSTGGTVERYLAYKNRNSLNPVVIPTLPQPAMEHARLMKKLEAQGKLKGKKLAIQKKVNENFERADFYRQKGLMPDGRRAIAEVNANDNLTALADGTLVNGEGKVLPDHRWDIMPDTKREPEMKEVKLEAKT